METSESIGRWVAETFPGADPESPRMALRALEECLELCIAAGASPAAIQVAVDTVIAKEMPMVGLWSKGTRPAPSKIPGEAADVRIVLCGLATLVGFDFDAETAAKMKINRARKWIARGDGTGYHVKES